MATAAAWLGGIFLGWLLGSLLTPGVVSLTHRMAHALKNVQRIGPSELDMDLLTRSWTSLVERGTRDAQSRGEPITPDTLSDVMSWLKEDHTRDEMEEIVLVRTPRGSTRPEGILFATLYTERKTVFVNLLVLEPRLGPNGSSERSQERAVVDDLWRVLRRHVDISVVRLELLQGGVRSARFIRGRPTFVRLVARPMSAVRRRLSHAPSETCTFLFDLDAADREADWASPYLDFVTGRAKEILSGRYRIPHRILDEDNEPHDGSLWVYPHEQVDENAVGRFVYASHFFWAFVYGDDYDSVDEVEEYVGRYDALIAHFAPGRS